MSFWQTSDGQNATGEVHDNDFAPLPKDWYPSMLEEVKIKEWQGRKSISLKSRVVGDKYNNRVLFLGLKCYDDDGKKRDRALNLLVSIANAVGVKLPKADPDDMWLSQLQDRPLDLMVDVFNLDKDNGEKITGNFLINARPQGKKVSTTQRPTSTQAQSHVSKQEPAYDEDDDIPF